MNEQNKKILDLDAIAIHHLIKNKKLTCEEVTNSYISHIKQVNPILNALVEDRFQDALIEAKEKDKTEDFKNKPLFGVPMSIKESYHVIGMKTTGGLNSRYDFVQNEDAKVVQKLKEAGAIILGKTNTPTLCFCQETDNKLYGRTNNPWDATRTAGGSSGGEGALLGAGGAALGIGSDIGGSIRFPSHFNGVVGFKPGNRQVTEKGHFPEVEEPLQTRMLGLGPMGKSVRDMELVYHLIARNEPEQKHINDFDIEFLPENMNYPLSVKSKQVLKEIKTFLQTDFSINEHVPPYFGESSRLWQEMMSIDGAKDTKKHAFPHDRTSLMTEFIKEKIYGTSNVHMYLIWALIGASLFKPSKKRLFEIYHTISEGDRILAKYLNKKLLVFPVYHSGAPRHNELYQELFSIRKTYLQYMPFIAYPNVWGLPSLTVPVGEDENNMPIGVQIISNIGNESAIFQVGKIIEAQFRGYIRTKTYD